MEARLYDGQVPTSRLRARAEVPGKAKGRVLGTHVADFEET
jgi:hypothetical protein